MEPGKRNEPPASQEAVRQRIMLSLHTVEKEANLFAIKFLDSTENKKNWTSMVNFICEVSGMKLNKIENYKEFEPLVKGVSHKREVTELPEYADLKRIFSRAEHFDHMTCSVRNDVESVFRKIQKYCVSFISDAGGVDCQTVSQYEASIAKWSNTITDQMQTLDDILDDLDQLKCPFHRFVQRYDMVMDLYNAFRDTLFRIMDLMKKWVLTDATYGKKLQDEITRCTKRKFEVKDLIKQLEFQKERMKMKLNRRAWKTRTIQNRLGHASDDIKLSREYEQGMRSSYKILDEDIASSKESLEHVSSKIKSRKENSTFKYNYLVASAENIREDVRKKELQKDDIKSRIDSFYLSQNEIQKTVNDLANKFSTSVKVQNTTLEKINQIDEDIKKHRLELQLIETRADVLKKIRLIKLSSDTVKKIYRHGYRKGPYVESQDDLGKACHIAVVDVGKDWTSLYHTLPFTPARELKKRSADVQDIISKEPKTDPSFRAYAYKSLQKWRELSRNTSVLSLVSALKRIKRFDTAKKIEQQLLTL